MLDEMKRRTEEFLGRMDAQGIDLAILTEQSSIAYFAGFWGYLGLEFGRPTFLLLRRHEEPVVITPAMEQEMVEQMTWIEHVVPWSDAQGARWPEILAQAIGTPPETIHVERPVLPVAVLDMLGDQYPGTELGDISPALGAQRTIKSSVEIGIMKETGRVGRAMMEAAHRSLEPGVREYEVALSILEAGTHAAADFLTPRGWEAYVSPLLHNQQIMQSGCNTSQVHRRAGVKTLEHGDPVYFCFCNLLEFKHYRLGFDRVFFVEEIPNDLARMEEVAIAAQRAALDEIRAGVKASDIARAANTVYHEHGYEPGYRTGRSIGMAYLESPELVEDDHSILQPGMTFAVDGGVTIRGRGGGRIGDSIVVTEDGFEFLTDYPRELLVA